MTKKRALVLINKYNTPPKNIKDSEIDRDKADWIMEYDVISNLSASNFEVTTLPLSDDLNEIKNSLESFRPHIVFNLLLEFAGEAIFDQNVVSYLEVQHLAYTGCNPRSLNLARNKSLAKQLLQFNKIATPDFWVFEKHQAIKKPGNISFPLIVKCLCEDASRGITQASLVHSDKKLFERVKHLHENYESDVIVEKFIPGREFSLGIIGNHRLSAFKVWELIYENIEDPSTEIYHSYAKWNNAYRKRKGIKTKHAVLDSTIEDSVIRLGKKVYKILGLNGYARIDFRLSEAGEIYVLEVNPNPDLSKSEDFAKSAQACGISYCDLLKRIASLGMRWQKHGINF